MKMIGVVISDSHEKIYLNPNYIIGIEPHYKNKNHTRITLINNQSIEVLESVQSVLSLMGIE